jgi:parvulin-like peptidyl-prolyl isomerase
MRSLTLALGLLALSLSAQAQHSVVATVGNKSITLEEFNRRYEDVRKKAANPPTKKIFLDDLIRYEMGVQEAEKRNMAKDPIVAERIRQQLYAGLIEKDLKDKLENIQVSEEEMKQYYSANPEVRTSHILVEIKPGATEAERAAAHKRAEEINADVKKSKRSFEELVKLYTDDLATKNNGGDVGYQARLSLVPGFSLATSYYDTAIRLKNGEISNIVETPYGFHIIKKTGQHAYGEANKRLIRGAVFEKKKIALFNEYFEKLKGKYKISVNSDIVK